jgi:hypothetical protein
MGLRLDIIIFSVLPICLSSFEPVQKSTIEIIYKFPF